MTHFSIPEILALVERANEISSTSHLDQLLVQMFDLILEVCGAESGTLYLLDQSAGELEFRLVRGSTSPNLVGKRIPKDVGIVGATIRERRPLEVVDIVNDPRWYRGPSETAAHRVTKVISFPLLLRSEPTGVIQIFNYQWAELELIQLLGNRMASEVEQAALLESSRSYSQRLEALVSIIGKIASSLDRDQILQIILEYASVLLDAEASSLFLVDEQTGDLVLQSASKTQTADLSNIRVPPGKGVIGHVVQTGETVLVADVTRDERYYKGIDQNTGFATRSILAVPLRSREIKMGVSEMNGVAEHVIGGVEVLNKRVKTFTSEDARLLETLASHAATVLQIADLYNSTNELFHSVLRVTSAMVDARDRYTEGHSQRVSDFAVAIATELGLPAEMVRHIQISGLLHDVGKIGVADAILNKTGALTPAEFAEMKKHPTIGANILKEVAVLKVEMAGVLEHHEKLDGSGYPAGLRGDQISLMGRVLAAADVFDALTSDRPYRKGWDVEETFEKMINGIGTHFDGECVHALIRAYTKNLVHTQHERERLKAQ